MAKNCKLNGTDGGPSKYITRVLLINKNSTYEREPDLDYYSIPFLGFTQKGSIILNDLHY